jgi:hypothetical protein
MLKKSVFIEDVSWIEYNNTVKYLLAAEIKKSKINFDYICGVPRGGLVPAVILSHVLDIPIIPIKDIHYGFTVLLIDDIADSGKTLETYSCLSYIKTAVVYYKPRSKIVPDFYGCSIVDHCWVKFPYESDTTDGISKSTLDNYV